MEIVALIFGAVIFVLAVQFIFRTTKGTVKVTQTYSDVNKYKNRGRRRVGRDPEVWHYAEGGIGLTLKYTIDGREVCGVLDRGFTVSEADINAIVEANEEVDVVVDPDDPGKFCLLREFYSSGPNPRAMAAYRSERGSVVNSWLKLKLVIWSGGIILGLLMLLIILEQFE